jgi:quinol-cytochrome oxidoreductase complex cytochrome b subunit
LFAFTISRSKLLFRGFNFSPLSRLVFWLFVSNFFLLTWLGRCPAEDPYNMVALGCTLFYFATFSLMCMWSHLVTYFYLNW